MRPSRRDNAPASESEQNARASLYIYKKRGALSIDSE